MGNAGKGPGRAQERKKGAGRTGVAAGKENGWGGRRHRLGGDGQNVRFTVTLTRCDMDLLELMRVKLGGSVTGAVTETVTAEAGQGVADGQVGQGLAAGQASVGSSAAAGMGESGSNRNGVGQGAGHGAGGDAGGSRAVGPHGGLDGIRVGGRVSQAAVIRRALRLLALVEGG